MGGARLRVWLVLVVVGGGLSVEASAPADLYRQSSDPVLRAITHAARRGALDRVQAGAYRQAYADAVARSGD